MKPEEAWRIAANFLNSMGFNATSDHLFHTQAKLEGIIKEAISQSRKATAEEIMAWLEDGYSAGQVIEKCRDITEENGPVRPY